jgi:hypothetical protein
MVHLLFDADIKRIPPMTTAATIATEVFETALIELTDFVIG